MDDSAQRPRLLLADDQPLLLDAFRALLEPEFDVVAMVSTEQELLAECTRLKPDAIVVDIKNGRSAFDLGRRVRIVSPRTTVIHLTDATDEMRPRNGSAMFVQKSSSARELKRVVRQAVQQPGRVAQVSGLTSRQVEVLQLLAQGLSMKQVADRLKVTPRTVAFHKYNIMSHLRVETTAELVQFAMKHGLVYA